jgi:hypothetical protein
MLTGPPTPLRGKPLLQLGQVMLRIWHSTSYYMKQ